MKEKYQCLVAGFAELDMDMKKNPYTMDSLVDDIYTHLDEEDIPVFQLLQLRTDIYNIARYIDENVEEKEENTYYEHGGTLGARQLDEIMHRKNMPVPDVFPVSHNDFIEYCIAYYKNGKEIVSGKTWEDQFLSIYFEFAAQFNNAFIKKWLEFEQNIRNLQVAVLSSGKNFGLEKKIVGENEFTQALQTVKSKDFGLSGEYDYVEKMLAAMDDDDLVEQEKAIDREKWRKLDEFITFNYFSLDVVLAYFAKYSIAQRWLSMDEEKGETYFEEVFNTLLHADNIVSEDV